MREFHLKVKDSLKSTSSMGDLLKWRIIENGKVIYIKTSTQSSIKFGVDFLYESYSEVIVSRLAKDLGLDNIVNYYLCKIHLDNGIDTIGCYSYSFLKEGEVYISIGSLVKNGRLPNYAMQGYDGYIKLIQDIRNRFGIEYEDELRKIITLDFITLNADRHLNNFGFIYNIGTKKLRIAPIFDNGNSLFSMKFIEEFDYNRSLDKHIMSKPFYNRHELQLKMIETPYKMNKDIRKTLDYIKGLEKYGLSKERSKFIQKMLLDRVNLI